MSLLLAALLAQQLPFVPPPHSRTSTDAQLRSGSRVLHVWRDRCGKDDEDYYCEIAQALSDAEDGDTILTHDPDFTYNGFTVSKSVVICALEDGVYAKGIEIVGVDGPVVISGIGIKGERVEIVDCVGPVTLEAVDFVNHSRHLGAPAVLVQDCDHVILDQLWLPRIGAEYHWTAGAITIFDSFVRISKSFIEGEHGGDGTRDCWPFAHGGGDGDAGIFAERSFVSISHCTIAGGDGGDSGAEICYEWEGYNAGSGGSAVRFRECEFLVFGTEDDVLSGGDGGDRVNDEFDNCAGSGGDGIHLMFRASSGVVSRVTTIGGLAGDSNGYRCDERDGVGIWGDAEVFDELATFTAHNSAALGESFDFTIDSVHTGRVILIATGAATIDRLDGFFGPPLALDFHSFWLIWPLGPTDDQGDVRASLQVPPDPELLGTFTILQALVCTSHGDFVTNAVPRTITTRSD